MPFSIFKRKELPVGAQKPRFWEFWKRGALQAELRKTQLFEHTNRILELTLERDRVLNNLISHLQKTPKEEEFQFQHRLESARGLYFSDPQVLEAQRKINAEIEQYCRAGKIKFSLADLEKSLGGNFVIKNLGWSGGQRSPLGKGSLPDLGVYLKKREQV